MGTPLNMFSLVVRGSRKLSLSRASSSLAESVRSKSSSVDIPDSVGVTSESSSAAIHDLLSQFVLPPLDPADGSLSLDEPNEHLRNLARNWLLSRGEFLPLRNPTRSTPFEYFTAHNSDPSYIAAPRLSVTRLLTKGWCELRDFYSIFAGLIRFEKTSAMIRGTLFHEALESTSHSLVDVTLLKESLKQIFQDDETGLTHAMTGEQLSYYEGLATGNPAESMMALEWSSLIISRTFDLVTRGEAREVLVHAFLDFDEKQFISNSKALINRANPFERPTSVLISGVIDHIQLNHHSEEAASDYFREMENLIEFTSHGQLGDESLVDVTRFLAEISKQRPIEHDAVNLSFGDVKTRSIDAVPQQESVIESAKLQTFYYRHFFELLLTRSPDSFGYYSLLENARLRGLDVDAPINVQTILQCLRKDYHVFYHDFVALKNGDSIGFEPYDKYVREADPLEYDFGAWFRDSSETDLHPALAQLERNEGFPYSALLKPELLSVWKHPPTLRYFAARSYQMYSMFAGLVGHNTFVEYVNVRTGNTIQKHEYQYNAQELNSAANDAARFWNGERAATSTKDTGRCESCVFRPKCLVPNVNNSGSQLVGALLEEFIRS